MSRHNLEIFFHMKNHYKKLKAVKCVVDTGRSRLEQHHSKNAALKNFHKKKRISKTNNGRTLSDSRPQTRRNLLDIPSQTNRSQSTKRPTYKTDQKKNKQLPKRTEPSTPDQKGLDMIELDSLNNTDNEIFENGKISPVPEEATSSVYPKPETHDVTAIETNSNIAENVVEDKNYSEGHAKTCISEHEYSQFLLRITEDIIRNECYTMDMILNVFKSHIEANKSHLDLDKMLLMIKQLCSEINFPIEIKEMEEGDENEQCRICFDYSSENMKLNCADGEFERQEKMFNKCETNDGNRKEANIVKELANSLDVSTVDDQTKNPNKQSLSERLRRCLGNDEEISPKIKKEISRSLRHKNEEKGHVKNDVESKEVTFCNFSSVYSTDIDCNESAEEAVEVIKLPPKAFIDESCFGKNSVHLSSSNNTTTTCDLPLDTNKNLNYPYLNKTLCQVKAPCKGTEIQTDFDNETKCIAKEKNQPMQKRAVGVQWGKCFCLNDKSNQTANSYASRECSTSKIVPKSIDASTQYTKTERGCPISEYKTKKTAQESPEKVDASIQYDKADENIKCKTEVAKNDVEENLNSRKEKFKICIQSPENNGWNSKIEQYKLLLQDLFSKCENQCADGNCGTDFGNESQNDVKKTVETNFNGYKKSCENGTISDKGCYNINEYKSMLQDLFQKCNVITQGRAPTSKVHQATNATPKLLLDKYEIKACRETTVPIKSYCPLKTTKETEIFISPVYENWHVSSKDAKFSREVAHQYPQMQEDFHVTVMHDAFTSMPNKQLFTSPYCNSTNRICDKRDNFLLDSTYENNQKGNIVLPLTLAAFFPNAETQTTDIDRHLATRLIMSVQAPTKEEIPKRENYDVPQNIVEVSPKEKEEQNKTVGESPNSRTKLKKGSLKPENRDRRRSSALGNRMVSVGNIEEVPYTFENDMKGYGSELLPIGNARQNMEDSLPESSQGATTFDEDLKDNSGGSEEVEVENIEEEDDIIEPDSSELIDSEGKRSRKQSGRITKQTEQTEKQDELILSDESEYNCCGRKKIYTLEMTSQIDRLSARGSTWAPDKQALLTDVNVGHKNVETQQTTREINKEETLKKGDKRLTDKNIESIKKRFDRRNSSFDSDEIRIEQTVRKTLGDKVGKDRLRTKSHYVDEENLEVVRTRSKKRNTLMLLEDEVSNDS